MKNLVSIKDLFSNNKFSFIEIYLYFAFIGLLFSLGSNVGNLNSEHFSIIKSLFEFRSLSPWIILSINIIILIKLFIKKKVLNINPIIFFFLLYIMFQIIGFYLNNLKIFHFHFIVGSLSFISLILIILNIDKNHLTNIINIYLIFIIIFIIFFLNQNPSLSYGSGWINFDNEKIVILNSNGFSRYFVILYLFCLVKLFLSNRNSFLLIILLILFGTIINFFEGRFNIVMVSVFSLIIFFKKTEIINKIITYFIISILPIFLTIILSAFIYSNLGDNLGDEKNILEKLQDNPTNRFSPDSERYFNKKDYFDAVSGDIEKFSTGRIGKWKIIIQHKQANLNKIFGNGPEYDRKILSNVFHAGNDSANSLFYIYLSGGLISVFLVLILTINQLIVVYKKSFKNNTIKDEYLLFAIFIFVFIGARGLLENGFGAWGMDQILFILFGSLINIKPSKPKK